MNKRTNQIIMEYKEFRQIQGALRRDLDAIHNKLDEILEADTSSELNDKYADAQYLINTYNKSVLTAVYVHYLRKKDSLED